MNWRSRLALGVIFAALAGGAAAEKLTDIVWDGFSYPQAAGRGESCDAQRYPSCRILLGSEYETRFADKLKAIVDDRYRFVNFADEERGETLHLTITVNLEWSVGTPSADAKPSRYDRRYTLCSTLLLYRADSGTYSLENAASRCSSEFNGDYAGDMDGFVRELVYGKSSDKTVNLEETWLAEVSSLISRRRNDFKRVAVTEVDLADSLFAGDAATRESLRLYLAETLSADLSQILRRPVIPPALSGSGQLSLRFRDGSRNRNIRLPIAAHTLSLKILPFQRKLSPGPLAGQQVETYFTIFSVTHRDAAGGSYLSNAGFYQGTKPRILIRASENADVDRVIARVSENANLELLGNLSREFAAQLGRPDKRWVEDRVYKTDASAAMSGIANLAKELSK